MSDHFGQDRLLKEKIMAMADPEMLPGLQQRSQEFDKLMAYYRCAMMEIETKFNVLNEEYSLLHDRNPISAIKSRLKTFSSIQGKLRRKGIEPTVAAIEEKLNDVAGIRVICPFLDDVYALADALLKQDDVTLIERKDYIQRPKANGYRSLHLIVSAPIYMVNEKRQMKVEIQLRTLAMDFWATLDHQLRYKKEREFTPETAVELYECAQMSAQLDKRMDALRQKIETQEEKQ